MRVFREGECIGVCAACPASRLPLQTQRLSRHKGKSRNPAEVVGPSHRGAAGRSAGSSGDVALVCEPSGKQGIPLLCPWARHRGAEPLPVRVCASHGPSRKGCCSCELVINQHTLVAADRSSPQFLFLVVFSLKEERELVFDMHDPRRKERCLCLRFGVVMLCCVSHWAPAPRCMSGVSLLLTFLCRLLEDTSNKSDYHHRERNLQGLVCSPSASTFL